MTTTPDMTVVVCSHNGGRTLAACVAALAQLDERERFQIVIVDDGSTDTTGAIADASGCEVIHLSPNGGLSAARNAGIRAARAPLIAFTDDDCVPPPTWAVQHRDAWRTMPSDVTCLGGQVRAAATDSLNRRYVSWREPLRPIPIDISDGATFVQRIVRYVRGPEKFASSEGLQPVASVVGANMSYRAEALAHIGGFNPTRTFSGDETWVSRQLRDAFGPHTVVCHPDIVMRHDFDVNFSDTLRRSFQYGIGSGRDAVLRTEPISLQPLAGVIALSWLVAPWVWQVPLAITVLLPWLLHVDAISEIRRTRSALLFPYMVVAEEALNNVGWFVGVWRTLRQRARR